MKNARREVPINQYNMSQKRCYNLYVDLYFEAQEKYSIVVYVYIY